MCLSFRLESRPLRVLVIVQFVALRIVKSVFVNTGIRESDSLMQVEVIFQLVTLHQLWFLFRARDLIRSFEYKHRYQNVSDDCSSHPHCGTKAGVSLDAGLHM